MNNFPSIPGRRCVAVVGLLLSLAAAGCGSGLYPVRGKVTFPDGTPMTEGTVVFESVDGDKPVTARGPIQSDGSYELGTHKPGDGAPPGKYRVLVAPKYDPNAVDKKPAAGPPLDPRFTAFETSGLKFEVTAGNNDYPIQISRPGKAP
jgi:hypothetical protein